MRRVIGLLLAGLALLGAAVVAKAPDGTADKMRVSADALLKSLSPELRKKAEFAFDSPHRTGWFFTPQQAKGQPLRKGLRVADISEDQKALVMDLVKSGTSASAFKEATAIMALESTLKSMEKGGSNVRNPEWYFVSIFGTPSKTDSWGWRFEGHHLSMNLTIKGDKVESITPMMFGSNPAEIQAGELKGLRALPEVEDRARELLAALGDDGRKVAKQAKPFPEIGENTSKANVGDPVGLAYMKMDAKAQAALTKLIAAYTNRMPAEMADAEWKRIRKEGLDPVTFGYSGTGEKGTPFTYRVQGKTFVIEFLNVQADGVGNPNNHIHSAWRCLPADFGL